MGTQAQKVVDTLFELGQLVSSTVKNQQGQNGPFDYSAFFSSEAYRAIQGSVTALLGNLQRPDLEAAVKEIEAKQTALLAGRKETDLSTDELVQYSALGDTKVLLTAQDLKGAINANYIQFLTENALPTLEKVLPLVLPLLL